MKNIFHLLMAVAFFIAASCSTSRLASTYVGEDQVRADITYLASDKLEGRAVGSKGETLSSKYIARRFRDLGLEPAGEKGWYQEFSFEPRLNPHAMGPNTETKRIEGRNVLGYIDNGALTTIVIGAHYDHLGWGGAGSLFVGEKAIHNGADDNASGVAGLLQLAAVLKDNYKKSNYLLIAFSGEERGLLGSNYFIKNPTVDMDLVNFMINMDMIGRLDPDRGLAVNGSGTSPVWKRQLERANQDDIKLILSKSGIGPSDHTSFYYEDIPVLHFFTGQHEDYHKPSDDADKINYRGIEQVVDIIEGILGELHDEAPIAFTATEDSDPHTGVSAPSFKVTLGVMPDYLFDGKGMRIDGVREGRPASNAGILKGDVVVRMGEIEVTDMMTYMEALGAFEEGQTVIVEVLRDGKKISKEVTF